MKDVIKCLVVDDEPLAVEGLVDYIEETDFLITAATARNAVQGMQILSEQKIDLLFLDIHMPKMSGIEMLKQLKNPPEVIFTTAHREYALDGFELDCVDYLLKPISFPRFLRAVNKVKTKIADSASGPLESAHFYVKENGIFVKINYDDILYVEGVKDYIFIHTEQKRRMVHMTMKSAEEQLGERGFMRVHRSFIVNPEKVSALEGFLLHIRDKKIPVSKSYRNQVLDTVVGKNLWKRGGEE